MRVVKIPGVGMIKTRCPYHGSGGVPYKKFAKTRKARLERRNAKRVPDCLPTYGKYMGYDD